MTDAQEFWRQAAECTRLSQTDVFTRLRRKEAKGIGSPSLVMFVIRPLPEIEHVEQIGDRRAVHRHVGIVPIRVRVRKIVAAAMGEPIDVPIALDELQDRDMVGIAAVQGKTAIAELAESVLRRISRIIGRLCAAVHRELERPGQQQFVSFEGDHTLFKWLSFDRIGSDR